MQKHLRFLLGFVLGLPMVMRLEGQTDTLTDPAAIAPTQFETNAEPRVVQTIQLKVSQPLTDIVRLVQAGTESSVIIAFITNSPPYRVTAEDLVYLKDVGVPELIVSEVVKHSQPSATSVSIATSTDPTATNAPSQYAVPNAPGVDEAPMAQAAPVVGAEIATNPAPASVSEFYQPLAPYGTWVDIAPYGWCWQPSVVVANAGWSPYCDNGYWLWSNSGWYWHSYYSWGWAPFHYGRWFYHPNQHWVWLPGRVWGPSWVSWRYGQNYCGWAPLPPGARFHGSAGWTYGGHTVGANFGFGLAASHYTFVPTTHFTDRKLDMHRVPVREAPRIYNQTTIINNYSVDRRQVVNRGVDRSRIETESRTRVPEITVRDAPRPGKDAPMPDRLIRSGRSDVVYRPGPQIELPRNTTSGTRGRVEPLPLPGRQPQSRDAIRPAPVNPMQGQPIPNRPTTQRPAPFVAPRAVQPYSPNSISPLPVETRAVRSPGGTVERATPKAPVVRAAPRQPAPSSPQPPSRDPQRPK